MISWEDLRRRKIVQWALAYLAGAWVTLEVTGFVGGYFGWPAWIPRALIVVAAVGLPLTMVLAWYHGEKGRQRMSGLELLLVTGLLVVAGASVQLVRGDPAAEGEAAFPAVPVVERSIAVLPLDNLSPAPDHAFFADAMTEEITSALTEIPELTVKSRNTATQFPGSGLTVREFARRIGVAHVIQGSVQRAGDEVRITVQLIDARTDEHLWTETFEEELTDLFEVQVEVAREVADRLAASFTERERERILAGATEDPVAYDLYLQAMARRMPGTPDEIIDLLRRALERDPDFWPARARLAYAYESKERRGAGEEWADSSRAAFRRAIESAEHEATKLRLEAQFAFTFGGDEEEAIARLRAAAASRPSDPDLAFALGYLYRLRGNLPEAARWQRHRAQLDPLSPGPWGMLFQIYYWTGQYEEAERALLRAEELDPRSPGRPIQLSWIRMLEGRIDDGVAAVDSASALGWPRTSVYRGLVHWWGGEVERAGAAFSEYDSSRDPSPAVWLLAPMAHTWFALGDSARASRALERLQRILDAWALEDYEPENRVFPRLQLAALQGDVPRAIELFRLYVDRGGRDPNWFEQSPVFEELRKEPAFRRELEDLARLVDDMRREIERDLLRGTETPETGWE